MPILFACATGVAVLTVLVLTGAMAAMDLSHPFWQTRASLIGGGVGLLVAAALLWIMRFRHGLLRHMVSGAALALSVVVYFTWRSARIFIDSADYEAAAGQMWFLGYHMTCALLVAFVALLVASLKRG